MAPSYTRYPSRMPRTPALVCLCAALLLFAPAARASSALELVRMAQQHEALREEEVAVRRYMEALALDGTCGEAYLGLGALRTRAGDLREAERVYSVALERIPDLRPAFGARARVRRALGFRREAVTDLFAGSDDEVSALRSLAAWHGEDGQLPAQLATWRRLAVIAEVTRDSALAREARTTVRALVLLVGPADPASSPPSPTSEVRAVVAWLTRRGGT